MPSKPIIQTTKLSKQYTAKAPYALKDLSIRVNKGEVFGFLGPNGAGKSTAIRVLLNLIQPTSGSAKIFGKDIVSDSVKINKSLGYLSGDFAVYEKMTGKQFLSYMNELQPPKNPDYVNTLVNQFKADLSKKIGTLSKGNRQKIGIIQAFMHEPNILILDEPTDGLDPLMQETFYKLVAETKKRGATIFVSSHNLSEVRKICDRVAIIKDGLLVSQSTISELAIAASKSLIITFKKPAPFKSLSALPKTIVTKEAKNIAKLTITGSLKPIFKLLAQYDVEHIATQEFNLEEEFMRYYETEQK